MFAYCQQYICGGGSGHDSRVTRNSALIRVNKLTKVPLMLQNLDRIPWLLNENRLGCAAYSKTTLKPLWIKITNIYFLFTVFLVHSPMQMGMGELCSWIQGTEAPSQHHNCGKGQNSCGLYFNSCFIDMNKILKLLLGNILCKSTKSENTVMNLHVHYFAYQTVCILSILSQVLYDLLLKYFSIYLLKKKSAIILYSYPTK